MARGPKRAPLRWLSMRGVGEEMLNRKEDGNGNGNGNGKAATALWDGVVKTRLLQGRKKTDEKIEMANLTRSISHRRIKRTANDANIKRLMRRGQTLDVL